VDRRGNRLLSIRRSDIKLANALLWDDSEGEMCTIAAILQTSVLAPHFPPKMTSGDLYCLVWISLVKWCPTQQALPRSAILTEIVSTERSSCIRSAAVFVCEGALDLSRLMPDTSFVRRSLCPRVSHNLVRYSEVHLRSLFPLLLNIVFGR